MATPDPLRSLTLASHPDGGAITASWQLPADRTNLIAVRVIGKETDDIGGPDDPNATLLYEHLIQSRDRTEPSEYDGFTLVHKGMAPGDTWYIAAYTFGLSGTPPATTRDYAVEVEGSVVLAATASLRHAFNFKADVMHALNAVLPTFFTAQGLSAPNMIYAFPPQEQVSANIYVQRTGGNEIEPKLTKYAGCIQDPETGKLYTFYEQRIQSSVKIGVRAPNIETFEKMLIALTAAVAIISSEDGLLTALDYKMSSIRQEADRVLTTPEEGKFQFEGGVLLTMTNELYIRREADAETLTYVLGDVEPSST